MDRRPEYRFQQLEKIIDNTTMSSTLQRQQRKNRQNRRMQHRTRNSAMATTKKVELKAIAYASRYLNDAEKKYSIGELELLAVVWGLERFRFHLYVKQKIFGPPSSGTATEKKQNQ